MFTKLSLEASKELSELLIDVKGLVVECKAGTPIDKLVEMAEPTSPEELAPATVSAAIESLEESTYTPLPLTVATHDNVMEDTATRIANLMNRRIHLARNVVNPLINRYSEVLESQLAGLIPSTPQVEEIDYGEFYNHPLTPSIFNAYHTNEMGTVDGVKGLLFNDENNYYQEALSTGSEFIDEKLQSILSQRGEQWYRDLCQRYFVNGEELPLLTPRLNEETLEEADRNLVIHMVARYLYSHEITPVSDTGQDSQYQLLLLLNRSAQNLRGVIQKKEILERDDIVTEDISKESVTVRVYKPTYTKFRERGGNPGMLIGYMRRDSGRLSGSDILKKGASLESIYDNEMKGELKSLSSNRQELLIDAALKGLGEVINGIPADVLATIPALQSDSELTAPQALLLRGQAWIKANPQAAGENIWYYASDIILKGLLPELELDVFYSIMSRHLKPSESGLTLNPKQAVYYAIVEEIVKYLVSQTNTKPVTKTISLEK